MIYFTSDTHLGHDKPFIYKARGFPDIKTHDAAIIQRWNEIITPEDEVYILGDLIFGDKDYGEECLKQLNGIKHFIRGNHDGKTKIEIYLKNSFIDEGYAQVLKYKKYYFYLSHYPAVTTNGKIESLKQISCNLFGHTHSKELFYNDIPWMYNVAVDAHNCYPISIDQILDEMKEKFDKYLEN